MSKSAEGLLIVQKLWGGGAEWGLLVQAALRERFGLPAPAAEHRAMDDVGVLSALVPPLLATGAAPSLQHFMESVLSNGAAGPHAGLVSDILQPKGTGGQALVETLVQITSAECQLR